MISGINPQAINDLAGARQAIIELLNLVEEQQQANQKLRAENQSLRDEVNRLKGEHGQPAIRSDQGKRARVDHSSEKERRQRKTRRQKRKTAEIKIDRQERLAVDKRQLPSDAQFKGYVESTVQDICITTDNVRFVKEKYYSPSEQQVYLAPLPAGYAGQFGPGVRSLVLTLYYGSGMSEPKIGEFLSHVGLSISAGQISNLLIKDKDAWHAEQAAIVRAGLASTAWQHADDTATRVDGENQHCHILCNPFYTAYFTRPGKDRLTLIHLLQATAEVQLLVNERTARWLDLFKTPQWAKRQIGQWPQQTFLSRSQMEALIQAQLCRLNDQQQARILEAAALTAYHAQTDSPIISILLSDDAPQFRHITHLHALCWIHEGRHFKKLTPFVDLHRQLLDDFLTQFWQFYHHLLDYKDDPDPAQVVHLQNAFDTLFSSLTGYHELDRRIAKTKAKKDKLLLVLDYPAPPLHNNPAELGARQRVRKRDISFGPRTDDGVAAWDTFMTLAETAKKLGVNFYAYIYDRLSGAFLLPSLVDLIPQP